MPLSNNDLIHRFRQGDRKAFERLVSQWDMAVLNVAYRLTGDLEEAKDIRQVAFLRAYQAIDQFNGHARFSTWMYRIVLNLCRDRLRARQVKERMLAEVASGRTSLAEATNPHRALEQEETARIVAEAVASLPQVEREVVVLRHYQDLSFREIAEILGTPASTVKSRMAAGLRALRARLKALDI